MAAKLQVTRATGNTYLYYFGWFLIVNITYPYYFGRVPDSKCSRLHLETLFLIIQAPIINIAYYTSNPISNYKGPYYNILYLEPYF